MKKKYKFNENASILLASDIHIGALKTTISLFKDFLDKLIQGLKNNQLKNLKALVILGDCFDLIMDTHQNFFEYDLYNQILNNFEILYNWPDFHLIFALGNHEVPVIGDYDTTFLSEKTTLLDEFNVFNSQLNKNYSFFIPDNFTQYIILKSDDSQKMELNLFDTKQQIAEEDGKTIPLENRLPVNTNILLAHGFQFDPNLDFYSKVWNKLLKIKSKLLKELADGIWNGFFKEIYNQGKRLKNLVAEEREDLITLLTKKYLKTHELEIDSFQEQELDELIESMYKIDLYRDGMNDVPFINQIKDKFLPDLSSLGYNKEFTHIIYGHTHRRWPRKKRMITYLHRVDNTILFNTGAWQHVDYPSFIQINNDGKINLVDIKPRKRKIEDKPPSNEIKQNLIREQQKSE